MIWVLFVTGCVPLTEKRGSEDVINYLKKGRMYEGQGKIPESLEQYGYAFKEDSRNNTAVEGIIRITDKFISSEKYYQRGLEYYKNGQYKLGRHEFETALEFWPYHPGAKINLSTAANFSQPGHYDFYKLHFQKAMELFKRQDYLMAGEELETSRRYKKDCLECQRSEEEYKDTNYKEGIRYFENEQLTEALRSWKPVQFIDPNYEEVNKYVERVMRLLKRYRHD